MSETTETKIKFGYLSYDEMLARIESGELNEYDVIYSKDRLTTFVISEELKPIEIRSRVYVYNSKKDAIREINKNSDTYVGQIVSILEGNTYRGYIVNQNTKLRSTTYTVEPLTDISSIDYDTLGNRPIINMVGTLDAPIIIDTLLSGIYKIKGQYKISNSEETIYLSADGDLFFIEVTTSQTLVKRFTKDSIYDFVITTDGISKTVYITDEYLKAQGYVTTGYIDTKIIALEDSIKKDVKVYVESVIADKVDSILDEKLTEKLNEMIQETPNKKVEDLFQ